MRATCTANLFLLGLIIWILSSETWSRLVLYVGTQVEEEWLPSHHGRRKHPQKYWYLSTLSHGVALQNRPEKSPPWAPRTPHNLCLRVQITYFAIRNFPHQPVYFSLLRPKSSSAPCSQHMRFPEGERPKYIPTKATDKIMVLFYTF
jgi:hypothetical protein